MENGLNNMSVSEIRMIAFGDPKRNDNAFTVSSYSNSYGAQTRFITCGKKNLFLNSITEVLIGEAQQMVFIG
jgi:hypothetical protein